MNQKLEQAIAYVLKEQPTNILRVVKLIYLADYLYAKSFGNKKPFTGNYYREKFGPLQPSLYPVLNNMYKENVVERTGNTLKLKKNIRIDKLNEEEIACLDKVLRDFSDVSTDKLLKVAYATEPMKKIEEMETAINDKLLYQEIDFDATKKHPLLENSDLDTRFMDSPEFLANLRDV
jgi:uncharacterized phage-associated protein